MALQSNQNVNEQRVYQQGGSGGEALLGAAALGGAGALAWKLLRKGKGGAPKAPKHPGDSVLKNQKKLPYDGPLRIEEDTIIHQGTVENMRKQTAAQESQNLQDKIKSIKGRRKTVVDGDFQEVKDQRSRWQKIKDGVNQMQDAAEHYGMATHGDIRDWQNARK